MFAATILGTGHALPGKVLRNADFPAVASKWIVERTGILERRASTTPDEHASLLAKRAAVHALESAGVAAGDLDAIVCTTVTPEVPLPSTACLVQAHLGATRAACMDLGAACSGFLYGLWVVKHLVGVMQPRHVLLVSVDLITRLVEQSDVRTAVLFGDGAAAMVLSNAEQGARIVDVRVGADGSRADLLYIPAGGSRLPACAQSLDERLHGVRMDGPALFKAAVERMSLESLAILEANGLGIEDVDLFVPHQANRRIIEAVGERVGIASDKVFINIETVGNTASASIPIALDQATRTGRLQRGMRVLLTSFGGGLTWGAALIEW